MANKGVCYFGSYDKNYSRNRIIIKGLKRNKITVLNCMAVGIIFIRYYNLIKGFLKIKNKFQVIIVGFPGWYDIALAFLLGKIFKKKVFFDVFISTYETYVLDRKIVNKYSPKGIFYYLLDWLGFKLADFVIVDTKTHGEFYSSIYGLKPKKTIVVYLGSDNDIFYPLKNKINTDVLFYGSYQPLQGAEYIVKAARLIPNVKFILIGNGQTKDEVKKIAYTRDISNVKFLNKISLKNLAVEVNKSKIVLGIFSNSQKAKSVIPNKVYDAIASKKPVITGKTKAIEEIFENGKNILLVRPENPKALASAITLILSKSKMKNNVANNSYTFYSKYLMPELVVKPLLNKIHE